MDSDFLKENSSKGEENFETPQTSLLDGTDIVGKSTCIK